MDKLSIVCDDPLPCNWISVAAYEGNIDVLKWAYDRSMLSINHLKVSYQYEIGVVHGHQEVCRYFNFNWYGDILSYAAHGGHLNVFKWIFTVRGKELWSPESLVVLDGYTEIMEWAILNGCPHLDGVCASNGYAKSKRSFYLDQWRKSNSHLTEPELDPFGECDIN